MPEVTPPQFVESPATMPVVAAKLRTLLFTVVGALVVAVIGFRWAVPLLDGFSVQVAPFVLPTK